MNGQFVISLDFEKIWGVFDVIPSNGDYIENIECVDLVIGKLLELSSKYNIKLTFSTVGFLFNKNKEEFSANTPHELPNYSIKKFDPYPLIKDIKDSEDLDNLHYGYQSLIKIASQDQHEIGTHTYCHYYCLEEGQTIEQFEADLKMAKKVASNLNIKTQSIVFPRNQINNDYLKSCFDNGIIAYRGFEDHAIYRSYSENKPSKLSHRAMRFIDSFVNITGEHTYNLKDLRSSSIVNLPASRFLRPYSKKLKFLEPLKINRVTKAMKKAAKNNELYHLWWHPHNFGTHMEENFEGLEKIFKTFEQLHKSHNFTSSTMTELANRLKK